MERARSRARSTMWTHRAVPYKACLVALLVGICPFLIGFSAPEWLLFTQPGPNATEEMLSFGLWELCIDDKCYSNPITGNQAVDDWFLTVVVCETLALPFYITSLVLASLQNFAPRVWLQTLQHQRLKKVLDKDSEIPEDLAFISGFLSFLGIIVFMIMTAESVSKGAFYSWGFAMSFTGASISIVTGLLMSKTHAYSQPAPQPPTTPRVVHTLSSPGNRRTDRRSGRRTEGRQSDRRSSERQGERQSHRRTERPPSGRTDRHSERETDRPMEMHAGRLHRISRSRQAT